MRTHQHAEVAASVLPTDMMVSVDCGQLSEFCHRVAKDLDEQAEAAYDKNDEEHGLLADELRSAAGLARLLGASARRVQNLAVSFRMDS